MNHGQEATVRKSQAGQRTPQPDLAGDGCAGIGGISAHPVEIVTDGKSEQHVGVLNAWADAILRGGEMIAHGEEGINGLTLSNAMHLSSFLGKTIELPLDEDLYYEELMKRVATSRLKEEKAAVFADTSNTYGGAK